MVAPSRYGITGIRNPAAELDMMSPEYRNAKFAGMHYDPATGQYYDDARWYSSTRGGFTSIDPGKVNVPRLSYDKIGFGKAYQ
jgi:RHS repeat-associated protein